jgi:uncharacterized protein
LGTNISLAFRHRDGLGLESSGVIGTEFAGDADNPAGALAMFRPRDGLVLALYRAHDRPWGIYSGYFRDLDGHLWEILWNREFEGS